VGGHVRRRRRVRDDLPQHRHVQHARFGDAAGPSLYGAPGNGKKHLARKIAETLSARFEQVNPSKLASAEQIEALWTSSRGTDAVVLFVPNAEAVFPRQSDGTSPANTLEWIAEWEKHEPRDSRVWVIMTTQSADKVDEAIVNHIGQDSRIEIKAPDTTGRKRCSRPPVASIRWGCLPNRFCARPVAPPSRISPHRHGGQASRRAAPAGRDALATGQSHGSGRRECRRDQDVGSADPAARDQATTAGRLQDPAGRPEFIKKGAKVPNILLYGPPGTGKTEIARTIANEAGVNFEAKNVSDLKGKYLGESGQNVKDMFAKARAKAPTVLFMDEIDGAAKARGSEGADKYTEEIVGELLAQMDGATKSDRPVFVLAATNLPESIDRAILERFTRRIEIPLPDETRDGQIFRERCRAKPLEPGLDEDALAEAVAKRTDGFSGRSLVRLIENAMNQALAQASSADEFYVTSALILQLVDELRATDSDKVDPTARWDTLVAAPETMVQLKQLSDAVKHMETFLRQGVDPPRGAVLWGPPGTGKTQIAKTLANESGVRFMFRTGADLGHTAQDVRKVFDAARAKAPCILFLDEFEKAAQSREKGGDSELVTELLAQMQGARRPTARCSCSRRPTTSIRWTTRSCRGSRIGSRFRIRRSRSARSCLRSRSAGRRAPSSMWRRSRHNWPGRAAAFRAATSTTWWSCRHRLRRSGRLPRGRRQGHADARGSDQGSRVAGEDAQ
jgi:SpoVK/Ycf46/Vps4 family AAA+-type ATPase